MKQMKQMKQMKHRRHRDHRQPWLWLAAVSWALMMSDVVAGLLLVRGHSAGGSVFLLGAAVVCAVVFGVSMDESEFGEVER